MNIYQQNVLITFIISIIFIIFILSIAITTYHSQELKTPLDKCIENCKWLATGWQTDETHLCFAECYSQMNMTRGCS